MPRADPRPRVFAVTTDLDLSGAKRVLVDGACRLDPARFRSGVLLLSPVPADDPLRRELCAAGVDVQEVRVRSRLDLRGLRALCRWIAREGRPDVLHTHSARSAGVVRLAVRLGRRRPRPRVVVHFHGTVSPRARRATHRWLDRALRSVTDLVVAPSLYAAACGVRAHAFHGVPVRVVPNGVDLHRIARPSVAAADVLRAWGVPPGARVVLLLGRWSPMKGQDLLLEAATRVPGADVRFVFVSPATDGAYRERLLARAAEEDLAGRVVVAPRVGDAASCYGAADLVAMPSRDEPFGLVAVEAMAAGKPLVAARTGGLVEVGGEDAGVIWVRPDDPADLARGIRVALEEPPAAREARVAGLRRRAERFDLPRYAAHLESAYAEVLARPDLLPTGGKPAGSTDVAWARPADVPSALPAPAA